MRMEKETPEINAEYITNIAQEISALLDSIQKASELLSDKSGTEQLLTLISTIKRETKRMRLLVGKLTCDNKTDGNDEIFRKRVVYVIRQHLSEPDFTIGRMAEMMNMRRTNFFKKMRETTGISPNKFLHNERLRIAAEMIVEGRYNISEICYKVGFQDNSYFYKCFKAKYGMAPSQYAKSHSR